MKKKIFLWMHRWFGLVAGFYFMLLGLSGSYLVYSKDIEIFFKPHLRKTIPSSSSLNLQEVVSAAKRSLATKGNPVKIEIPKEDDTNILVIFNSVFKDKHPVFQTIFVDPAKAEVRGREVFHETLMGKIFFFHHDLFMGKPGRIIMGISGILMVLLLLTGLILLRPSDFFYRGLVQWSLEFHKLFGFYSLILMISVTATGVYLSKPNWFGNNGRRPDILAPDEHTPSSTVNFEKIQESILREGLPMRGLHLRIDPISSLLHVNAQTMKNDSRLVFNLYSAKLISKKPFRSIDEITREIQHNIHSGRFWNELGRGLIFFSGLLPAFFYITGIVIWRRKKRRMLLS